jgi:DNA-binding IclR family transcriptional regulator
MTPQPTEDGHIRALRVLETLAGLQQPASLPTIAAKAQLTKTKAYRALRGLQEHGFVDHTGRGGYRIGSRAVALATLIGPRTALLQAARPVLAPRLAAVLGPNSSLSLESLDITIRDSLDE